MTLDSTPLRPPQGGTLESTPLAQVFKLASLQATSTSEGYRLSPFARSAWLRDVLGGSEELLVARDADPHLVHTALAPQALLFDMDGVMVDVSGSYRRAIEETVRSFGIELGPDEIGAAKRTGGCNNDWILSRDLLARHGVDVSLEAVTERFEELYQGTPERVGLRSTERLLSTRAWLETLRVPLAVVTGRPRNDARRLLDEHGLAALFPVMVCMGDSPAKPDPAPVQLAMRQLGVERAWMLGDTVDDVRAARAAGAIAVGVLAPGETMDVTGSALRSAGAARVLVSLAELDALVPE